MLYGIDELWYEFKHICLKFIFDMYNPLYHGVYVNRCNRIDSYILKLGVTAAFFVLNAINHCIENYFKQKSPFAS